MKTAIVFGARQASGYEICVQLLERGWTVHAVDHECWQEDHHEEKWMFIGRNAHLHFAFMSENHHRNSQYYFIPIVDYVRSGSEDAREELVAKLKEISSQGEDLRAHFIFLEPSAFFCSDLTFQKQIANVKKAIKNAHHMMNEYYLPLESGTNKYIYFKDRAHTNTESIDCRSAHTAESALISHFEENENMFSRKY